MKKIVQVRRLKHPVVRVSRAEPLKDARQERFVSSLMTEPNATAAAVKAGYSPASARIQAAKLLSKGNIRCRLAWFLEKSSARTISRRGDVLRRMSARGAASIADLLDLVGGTWEAFAERVKDHPYARAIKKVKRETVWDPKTEKLVAYVSEIEMFDSRASDNDLADMMGWKAPTKSEIDLRAVAGVIVLPAQVPAPVGVREIPGSSVEGAKS